MGKIEQLQTAIDEIRAVCNRHKIVLLGTCETEGIYGEITIAEANPENIGWSESKKQLTNKVENTLTYTQKDYFRVLGIGDLNQ